MIKQTNEINIKEKVNLVLFTNYIIVLSRKSKRIFKQLMELIEFTNITRYVSVQRSTVFIQKGYN